MSGAGDGATGMVLRVLAQPAGAPTDELGLSVLWLSLSLGLVLVLLFVGLVEWLSARSRRRQRQRAETLGAAAARMGQPLVVTADTAVGSLMAGRRPPQNPAASRLLSDAPPAERLLEPPRRPLGSPPRPLPPTSTDW